MRSYTLPVLLCVFYGLGSAWVFPSAERQEIQQPTPAQSEDTDATPKKAKRVPGLLPLEVAAELDPGGRPTAPALYHEGALIVVTDKGEAQSYDAETGALRWKLGLPGNRPLAPTLFLPAGVLLAYRSGMLLLADPTTGQIHREQSLGTTLALPPVIVNDTLYLATEDGPIMAYAWEEAREVWRVSLGEPALAMSVGGGLLVVSGGSGSLVALNAETGTPVWEFRGEGVFQAPAAFDAKGENLFIGDSAGFFYSLSVRTGKTRFRWGTGAAITVPPLVEADHVFMVSYANTLFVYRPGNGHELWRANLPGRPASAPVRVGRRVVVVTLDGQVVEFGNAPRASKVIPYSAPSEILPLPSYQPDGMVLPLRSGKILLLKTKQPPAQTASDLPILETPTEGETVTLPFTVVGWAINRAAASGTGVDAVHVSAHPLPAGPPIFLGEAALGGNRPDVGEIFGPEFTPSGYTLEVSAGLAPGSYRLVVSARSSVTGKFDNSTEITITVVP